MIDLSHNQSKRQAQQKKRFTLSEHTFSVDQDIIPNNSIRKQFRGLAHEAEANFESRVVNRCKSLDELIKYGSDIFGECMQPLWNACVQALISVGIVHIDVSEFIARYQDYYDYLNDAFDVVAVLYAVAWKAAVSDWPELQKALQWPKPSILHLALHIWYSTD